MRSRDPQGGGGKVTLADPRLLARQSAPGRPAGRGDRRDPSQAAPSFELKLTIHGGGAAASS